MINNGSDRRNLSEDLNRLTGLNDFNLNQLYCLGISSGHGSRCTHRDEAVGFVQHRPKSTWELRGGSSSFYVLFTSVAALRIRDRIGMLARTLSPSTSLSHSPAPYSFFSISNSFNNNYSRYVGYDSHPPTYLDAVLASAYTRL